MSAEWKSGTAPALLALVIGCWSTLAAAQPVDTDGGTDGGTSLQATDTCKPCTEPNGQGIYILERVNYCLEVGNRRFCPEAFVLEKTPLYSKVNLGGRFYTRSTNPPSPWTYVEWKQFSIQATSGDSTASVVDFRSHGTSLFLSYEPFVGSVREADLSDLTLELRGLTGWKLHFTKGEQSIEGTTRQGYRGRWTGPGGLTQAFRPGDTLTEETLMYVLPGKQVDGLKGKVTQNAGQVTTACASGAIATCMNWGYRPDELDSTDATENALLGACIQAKRAAYFLSSHQDTRSYTKDGKTIDMKDLLVTPRYPKGVRGRDHEIQALESVWTENGAQCLNVGNRRVNDPPLPNDWQTKLPACEPKRLKNWHGPRYIITGKVKVDQPSQ